MPHKTTKPTLELLMGKHYGAPEDIILLDLMQRQNERLEDNHTALGSIQNLHQPLAQALATEEKTQTYLDPSSIRWTKQAKVMSLSVSTVSLILALGISFGLFHLGSETSSNPEKNTIEYATDQPLP